MNGMSELERLGDIMVGEDAIHTIFIERCLEHSSLKRRAACRLEYSKRKQHPKNEG